MKKWMILAVMASMTLSIVGCKPAEKGPVVETPNVETSTELGNEETPSEVKTSAKWSIENIKFNEESKLLSYSVKNDGEQEIEYGLPFIIEKINGSNEWTDTKLTEDTMFEMVLLMVSPGKMEEDNLDLSKYDLSTGTYRIVRQYADGIDSYSGAVSFTVDEELTFDNFTSEVINLGPMNVEVVPTDDLVSTPVESSVDTPQ